MRFKAAFRRPDRVPRPAISVANALVSVTRNTPDFVDFEGLWSASRFT
jgi:hypothetical protein